MSSCKSSHNTFQSNTSSDLNFATAGGIIGSAFHVSFFSSISQFNAIYAKGRRAGVGGILGVLFYQESTNTLEVFDSISFKNNIFSDGLSTGKLYSAGIVSYMGGGSSNITNCNSTENNITSYSANSDCYTGGITSYHQSVCMIRNCRTSNSTINSVSTSNISYSGGISAYLNFYGFISDSYSIFNSLSSNITAGVVAYNDGNVTNCYYGLNIFTTFFLSGLCIAQDQINSTSCFDLFITTLPPSTMQPSTLSPSTFPPSTLLPSTIPPSSIPPSTLTPSTLEPSTQAPSTSTPSTLNPSTLMPSTLEASTSNPSTLTPSTLFPSTMIPSTLFPSTLIPSTSFPSSVIPTKNCSYNVPNCENCGILDFIVEQSLFNISCIFVDNKWLYSFKNKVSGTFVLSETINLNDSTILIDGNFNQTSNSTIIIVSSNQNKNGSITVNGCLSLNGNLSVILNEKPQDSNISIVLFNYNCTDTLNISDSQVTLKTDFQKSKCDKISSQLNNQPNTLLLTISSNSGKCKNFFIKSFS